jgi:hypothetical protein
MFMDGIDENLRNSSFPIGTSTADVLLLGTQMTTLRTQLCYLNARDDDLYITVKVC